MEGQSYREAAEIAGREFQKSEDILALSHQLNALYRADLFTIEKHLRDYSAAAAYLKVVYRLNPDSSELQGKKDLYSKLGVI